MEIIKLSISKQKKILNSTLSLTFYHANFLYAIVPGEKSLFEAPRFDDIFSRLYETISMYETYTFYSQ